MIRDPLAREGQRRLDRIQFHSRGYVESSRSAKYRSTSDAVFASYGELAIRLLPLAANLALYDATGNLAWSHGAGHADRALGRYLQAFVGGSALEPTAFSLTAASRAIALPVVLESKPLALLLAQLPLAAGPSERRLLQDTVGATAPLLDCLGRELSQMTHQAMKSATLTERTDELAWLLELRERCHSTCNRPRAVRQLMGAAVERMKCCFGAVVVPDHGIDLTYESLVNIDIHAAGSFERSRPYFMNFVHRRQQPLVGNKVSGSTPLPPCKLLLVPIQPQKNSTMGFIAFFKQASKSNFGRTQLFLGRHIGHQIGSLLESPYDLTTGLLTRHAFEQDVARWLTAHGRDRHHALVYFDIDRLHVINDAQGLGAGDDAIVRVADLLRAPALPDDVIACRISGDSFVVLLPNHDADEAATCATTILGLAARESMHLDPSRMPLSIRAGVVGLDARDTAIHGSLANAQMACHSAKRHGGNRVEIYR